MIVVLPHDTIGRILDRAAATPSATSKTHSRRAPPNLSESVIGALNKAKKDKANLVGPLEASDFNAMSAWCRSVGLTRDGELVEAAVRASG